TKVSDCFERGDFFLNQGAAQPRSLSYEGEYATKSEEKRALQNDYFFCYGVLSSGAKISFPIALVAFALSWHKTNHRAGFRTDQSKVHAYLRYCGQAIGKLISREAPTIDGPTNFLKVHRELLLEKIIP
ncbi:MAG: hypothetical protein KI786_10475, partial [Mameliella sp.]|nr:hypothetical protein [Phaeodactylibacter sp.]